MYSVLIIRPKFVKALVRRSEGELLVNRWTMTCAGAVFCFSEIATRIIYSHCSSMMARSAVLVSKWLRSP